MKALLSLVGLTSIATTLAFAAPASANPPTYAGNDAPGALDMELMALWEVAACGKPTEWRDANAGLERLKEKAPKVIADHCKALDKILAEYSKDWLTPARPFFKDLVPANIPKTVVYPFAGGDLMTALAVFPEFTELTTISLESGGDARGIFRVDPQPLAKALEGNRRFIHELVKWNHNRTIDLNNMELTPLPSQLIFALVGLKVHGFEPVGLRALAMKADGSLEVLGPTQFKEIDDSTKNLKGGRKNKALNDAFAHYELRFKRPGETTIRTYRHFRMNLSDKSLTEDRRILAHLEKKGRVSAMTKAASHLLWHGGFSQIREYLKANIAWMVSDSTGLNPRHLDPTKWEQTVWGRFDVALFNPTTDGQIALRELYASQPERKLPFKLFGYPTKTLKPTLIVTRPR